MTDLDRMAQYSPASVRCSRSLPVTVVTSSIAFGWTSVLLEHHRVDPDDEPFETVPTPDQTIVVMLKGEQDLACFRDRIWRHAAYRAGTIGMTPGGQIDRLQRRPRGMPRPFEKANLYVPQEVFRDAAEHCRLAGQRLQDRPLTALAFQDRLVTQTAAALLRGMGAGQPNLYAEAAVHWLVVHLLSTHRGSTVDGQRHWPNAITDRRLARVIEYMSADVAKVLTLEDLAAVAGVSKFHFTRLFRAASGTTPYDFLLGLRVEAARTLLTGTDLDIAEIAARCGFARAAQFRAAFSRRYGSTPTAYRRSLLS